MPSAHWELLASPPFSFLETLSAIDDAIDVNANIAERILACGLPAFGLSAENVPPQTDNDQHTPPPVWKVESSPSEVQKAHTTIRQFYRDWSSEGAIEREACYTPVLNALKKEFAAVPDAEKDRIRVLVPGAGLGRFLFEVVRAGYSAEGNEISYHQLLASSFILNFTVPGEQFPLFPWISSFANHVSRTNQLQKIMIPDVHPGSALNEASQGKNVHAFERLGMAAADFCVAYKQEENRNAFDAITTVFFVDTAPNIISYIETVVSCLKSGGVWINLGPLLWHFEESSVKRTESEQSTLSGSAKAPSRGIGEPGSVELTNEEVIALVERFGFVIEQNEPQLGLAGYIQNPRSMISSMYRPSFWVARKK